MSLLHSFSDGGPAAPGTSKGFGFAQFTSVEAAKAFLTPNFPFINIPPPASHGASALAIWKQAIASGGGPGQQQGRRVKIDFSQSAHTSDRARGRVTANDGTRDIGTSPAPIILLRGIDGVTTPAAVAVALRVANGPGREGAKGLKRVLLIKDRLTGLGSGFAFLEFVDQQVRLLLFGKSRQLMVLL
jgi:RNA-binding protein 5/10